jgi:hypothetical protein
MAQLAEAIATINARELDANEQALAQCFPRPPELSADEQQRVLPFIHWCQQQRIRAVPARPTSVAAYARYQQDQGISRQLIAERLGAIEALHNAASLGNPCATPVVRAVTGGSTIEAPRSWTKDEKQLFTGLPVEVQKVIVRRENDREREMRRAQNEAGDLRRLLKTAADTKPVEPKQETTNNGC